MPDYFQIGKIVSAHGIKGYVKVYPITDDPARFAELETVFLDPGLTGAKLHIEKAEAKGNLVLIKFEGIKDRNEAEALKGKALYIERALAAPLEEDEYYLVDLIGLPVQDTEGCHVGQLAEIIQTGAADVFYIKGEKSYLLPALRKNITPHIDKGMLIVNLANGVECD